MSGMTTDTVTPTRTSYEPDPALGTITAAIAVGGGVIAAVSLIAIWFGWFPGWYRFAPLPLVAFGWLLAIRFTRDDRDIAGRIARLEMDCIDYETELLAAEVLLEERDATIVDLTGERDHYLAMLKVNTKGTIFVGDRSGTRTIPIHSRNQSWSDAVTLLRLTADYGLVPGREKSGLSQDGQSGAISVLLDAKLITQSGNFNRLTCPTQNALDVLNWYAPDTSPAPNNLDASSSRQEVASSFVSSAGGSGEVAA